MADDDHQAKLEPDFQQLLDDLDMLAAKWSRRTEQVLERASPDLKRLLEEQSRQRRSNLH